MTWGVRRRDDDLVDPARTFATQREAQAWINERTMPWEFDAVDLDVLPTNLDDAIAIVARIAQVRAVQTELRSAFAKRELDGGAKAAFDHPLYQQAVAELGDLHERMTLLI